MDATELLALALDPCLILQAQGIVADPWQRDLLLSSTPRILLNCCRGAGKSRVTSALALHTALFQPKSLVLLISRAQRQAMELYRYCKQGYQAIGRPIATIKETETQLELANGSRIVSLPGKEANIRSYQGVNLLIIDEAARVPDDLYASVSPMTAIARGRQIILSTPFGQRGFYWREWTDETALWQRFRIPWQKCPRHSAEFIEDERRKFGDAWVEQEYECSFTSLEGLVYPDFQDAVYVMGPPPSGRLVGGIDWGWRNPFAAIWGALDRDDVLWIEHERYLRETPLHEHAKALPRGVIWYADPAGRTEIEEFRSKDFKVLRGDNDIRLGIAAVTARIRTGRLKVRHTTCPNLIAEAKLYRYPDATERAVLGEKPIDENNHALAALRYLISRLDKRFIARLRKQSGSSDPEPVAAESLEESARALYDARPWLRLDNEQLWED